MTAITAEVAARDLVGELHQLLARHDGATTLDEVRQLADELTIALKRARGRITRLAKRDTEPDTKLDNPPAEIRVQPADQPTRRVITETSTPLRPETGSPVARPAASVTRTPTDEKPADGDKKSMTRPLRTRLAKPVLLVVLTVLALILLTGCGTSEPDEGNAVDETADTSEPEPPSESETSSAPSKSSSAPAPPEPEAIDRLPDYWAAWGCESAACLAEIRDDLQRGDPTWVRTLNERPTHVDVTVDPAADPVWACNNVRGLLGLSPDIRVEVWSDDRSKQLAVTSVWSQQCESK